MSKIFRKFDRGVRFGEHFGYCEYSRHVWPIATFLFGMSTMTDGLEKLSSGRLEHILERLTSNVFKGSFWGPSSPG